jgi:hypothetical protein
MKRFCFYSISALPAASRRKSRDMTPLAPGAIRVSSLEHQCLAVSGKRRRAGNDEIG